MPRKKVLSGMRPTGKLHVGHYFGALVNWLKMQEEFDCFFFVADWHALTSDYADTSRVREYTLELATDWLACGLDPKRATLFIQSHVPEHAELNLLLGMITPLGWLLRVPTYKEQREQIKDKDLDTFGFLGYPVLQSADILMYKADQVPVGEDQVAHVELTREIARRFNNFYGWEIDDALFEIRNRDVLKKVLEEVGFQGPIEPDNDQKFRALSAIEARKIYERSIHSTIAQRRFFIGDAKYVALQDETQRIKIVPKEAAENLSQFFPYRAIFPEPQAYLTPSPRIPGLDGRKMSKSYGNTILLSEPERELRKKIATMMTDPARVRRSDPGNPEVCPVFDYHKVVSPPEVQAWSDKGCRTAGIGCIECKQAMADGLMKILKPIQERRRVYEEEPQRAWQVIEEGSERARVTARATMEEVRAATRLSHAFPAPQPAPK